MVWASEPHRARVCSLSTCLQNANPDGLDFAIEGSRRKAEERGLSFETTSSNLFSEKEHLLAV
jgi:hypothetical protein